MKTVAVLGATGLIGNALCDALGEKFTVARIERKARWPGDAIRHADYIVHAAGYAQPAKFMAEPLETIRLNTTIVLDIVNAMKPGARFLYLSTSEVYSGSPKQHHKEDDIGTTKPTHPRAAYVESKRCGEAIVHAARSMGKLASIARISLVYGPGTRADDKRVLNELIMQAVKFGRVTPKDGGSARRTYCYISDAVEMLSNILIRGTQSVYNVGGMGEITIYGLARKIAELAHVELKVPRNQGQAMEGAPAHVTLDLSAYMQEFGDKRFVSLDDGLHDTLAWYRELLGIAEAA